MTAIGYARVSTTDQNLEIQEAALKVAELPGDVRWHLIGHLQTNKVSRAARELIDSLVTDAPPRNRESEALKARARSAERFRNQVAIVSR